MPDPIANRPPDVPTRETLEFLVSRIPIGAKVLEVGCGEGQIACELLQRGYRVTGLDSDSEAIARAQARGVRGAICGARNSVSSVFLSVSESGASGHFSGRFVCRRSFSTGNYSGKPRRDRVSRSANRGLAMTSEMRNWARVDHFLCSLLFA